MKLKTTVKANDGVRFVTITIVSSDRRNLTSYERREQHERKVNAIHNGLRSDFDARQIKVK